MSYRINEIFYSLQGEGYFTGTPAVFLRMSGCNLKCGFCDTRHDEHTLMSPAQIVEAIGQYPTRHIIITGGEPSLHEGIDWVTCSPKPGPTGEISVSLRHIDELKVVYEGQDVEAIANSLPAMHYYLQPCSSPRYAGGSNTAATVSYILAHPHWRLSLQTHKLIDIQ